MSEILDISTKKERPSIRIDGVPYELMLPADLELREVLWLQKASKRVTVLQKMLEKDDAPDAVAAEFEALLRRFANLILGEVPKEVCERLTDVQRMSVVDTYAELLKEQQESFFVSGADSAKEEKKDGLTSSLSSKGSMEETSRAG